MMQQSRARFSLGVVSLAALLSLHCKSQEPADSKGASANPVALEPAAAEPAGGASGRPVGATKGASDPAAGAQGPSADTVASALMGTGAIGTGAGAVGAGAPSAASAGTGASNGASNGTAAAGTGATVKGAVSTGEGFAVHLEALGSYTVGTPSSVKVVLKATSPFHCNDKYPYKFTPTPGAGLTFKEAVARGMNIAPNEATMDVGFTSTQAGKLNLSGELSFSVCTEDRCLVEKQPLSVTLNVKDAS
jgi:hypothetical protein